MVDELEVMDVEIECAQPSGTKAMLMLADQAEFHAHA